MTNEEKDKLQRAIDDLADFYNATNFARVGRPLDALKEMLEEAEVEEDTPAGVPSRVTVRGLLDSLGKWKVDDTYEVAIRRNPYFKDTAPQALQTEPEHAVILVQDNNSIRLN